MHSRLIPYMSCAGDDVRPQGMFSNLGAQTHHLRRQTDIKNPRLQLSKRGHNLSASPQAAPVPNEVSQLRKTSFFKIPSLDWGLGHQEIYDKWFFSPTTTSYCQKIFKWRKMLSKSTQTSIVLVQLVVNTCAKKYMKAGGIK